MLETLLDKGIEPVKWLIVIGIAYTMAMTIWVFFETPVSAPVAAEAVEPDRPSTADPVNVNWILSKHLFGEAGAVAPAVARSDLPSVETRLPLILQSVFQSDVAEDSSAIVAEKGKSPRVFRIGDTLPGNAELVAVERDRIYLSRAGVRETLTFPKTVSSGGFAPEPAYEDPAPEPDYEMQDDSAAREPETFQAADEDEAGQPPATIDEAREQFSEDAAGTLSSFGIESAPDGGYRIGNLAQSPFLRQTGLQTGDVIVSINGQPVGDLEQDQMQVDNILAQGSARIEVQRGSRRFFITAPIPGSRE